VVKSGVRLALGIALAIGITAASRGASAASFAKGPYLQDLATDAVTVKLELDEPAPASLSIVDGATHAEIKVDAIAPAAFHALRATGLAPSTSYAYTVTIGAGDAAKTSEVGHFTTAPADARPFKFLVYGDSRSDDASHAAVVRAMSQRPADFLVNTGDVVYRGSDPGEWKSFFRVEGATLRDRCVFTAVGNHELAGGSEGAAAFMRYLAPSAPTDPPRLYGTFRWSNTRFFLLNAMDDFAGGPERAWLEAALERAASEPGLVHRVAVLHHGPFSSGPHRGNQRLGAVVQTLRDHGVDLLLAGHDHIYERGEGAGIKYVITGGAGAPLYPREAQAPETQSFESVHHFVEVAVDGDRISTTARRAEGTVIESCSFVKGAPWSCDAVPSSPSTPLGASKPGRSQAASSGSRGSCACGVVASPEPASIPIGFNISFVISIIYIDRRRRRSV
jgi:predicted phosphodiesterase